MSSTEEEEEKAKAEEGNMQMEQWRRRQAEEEGRRGWRRDEAEMACLAKVVYGRSERERSLCQPSANLYIFSLSHTCMSSSMFNHLSSFFNIPKDTFYHYSPSFSLPVHVTLVCVCLYLSSIP